MIANEEAKISPLKLQNHQPTPQKFIRHSVKSAQFIHAKRFLHFFYSNTSQSGFAFTPARKGIFRQCTGLQWTQELLRNHKFGLQSDARSSQDAEDPANDILKPLDEVKNGCSSLTKRYSYNFDVTQLFQTSVPSKLLTSVILVAYFFFDNLTAFRLFSSSFSKEAMLQFSIAFFFFSSLALAVSDRTKLLVAATRNQTSAV